MQGLKKIAWAVVCGVLAVSGSAKADVTSPAYDVRKCRSSGNSTDGSAYLDRGTAGQLKAKLQQANIICPVVRTTSAPGHYDDDFLGASIPVVGGASAVTCRARVWRSDVPVINNDDGTSYTLTNLWNSSSTVASTTKVVLPALDSTNYWDGASQGGSSTPAWFYMDLECTLPVGSIMKNYTVTEAGTDHGYRIYDAANCSADPTNNMQYGYIGADDYVEPGGYIRGQAATGYTNFAMQCPVPGNTRVDVSMGKTGGQPIGCNLDSTNLSSPQWPVINDPNGTVWPSQVVPAPPTNPSVPFISIPSTGTHNLICGIAGPLGDGKILSYRSTPPDRGSWVVSASNPNPNNDSTAYPTNVKDNNGSTRWTTKTAGLTNQWFKVDFGASKPWTQVTMDSGTSTSDYARGYRIEGSYDGNSWTTYATGTGTGPFITNKSGVHFSRYVRIVLTQNIPGGSWWSMHELNIY
jgi:hypothetical protein